jgi:hypothetical protein
MAIAGAHVVTLVGLISEDDSLCDHKQAAPAGLVRVLEFFANLRGGTETTTASAGGTMFNMAKLRLPSFGRCRKQHRWILFRFVVPLYHKMVRCIRRRKTTEKTKDAPHSASAKANLCDLGTFFLETIRETLHCYSQLFLVT